MTFAADLAVALLLGLGVAVGWFSALGVTVARTDLDRLHFLSPLTALAVPAVGVAVVVRLSPISLAGAKVLVIVVSLWIAGPVAAHALARAERIRDRGDGSPTAGERARGGARDERSTDDQSRGVRAS